MSQRIFRILRWGVVAGVMACLATAALPVGAQSGAWFVRDGALVRWEAGMPGEASTSAIRHKGPVFEYLGVLAGGRVLVSLGVPNRLDSMISGTGVEIAILSAEGAVEQTILKDAVRAWPSPSGSRIAVIDLDYSLHVFENGTMRALEIGRPVVLAAWSPDESRLCLTAYPPGWSPHRMHNPESTEEFLHLINSDLFLFDLATSSLTQLTDAPGYDYSGVWFPDGGSVMFISSRDEQGAFFKLDVRSGALAKLTNKTPGSYDVPVGRSDSFVWSLKTNEWIYSAQEADSLRDSIRALSRDGATSRILGYGRQIRLIDDGRAVAFLGADDRPASVNLIQDNAQ